MESVGDYYEYSTKSLIGHGAFALVYKGQHRTTKVPVAIKCINKKNLGRSSALLVKEINILKELHHENIVQLYECETTAQCYFLVMEYCNGGDLADYLAKKGTLREDTIRMFFRQIANAMKAMHDQGILHRDLKPQNLLLSHKIPNPKPPDIVMKIADFGFARHLQSNMMAATLCGSPMYMAPEVITSKQYNAKADLWSIGTIIYQCLVGSSPFHANTPQELRNYYERTRRVEPKIPNGTSRSLTELLLRLLKRNVAERINFNEFFNHEFFVSRSKTSPMPVPVRATDSFVTPNSSNTSDPRSVIDDSPQVGIECSPSEGDPLFLPTSSSGSDSEDFVIVSHPFSSNDSLKSMQTNKNKDINLRKVTQKVQDTTSKHGFPRPKTRSTNSPIRSEEDAEIVRVHSRENEIKSPFMQRALEGAGSPITVRYSGLSSRRRAGSGSDSDASSHSRPSPVPIPVPTQVENFGRFERQSNYSYEEKIRLTKSKPRSVSPLCVDSSNLKQVSPYSGHVGTSLPALQKALKMISNVTPPDFPPILENPDDTSNPKLDLKHDFKCIFDNKKETLVSRMARAWTAPDLAKLNQRYLNLTRSKSSAGLYKQEMETVAEEKGLDNSTNKSSMRNGEKSSKKNFSNSIFELSPPTMDDAAREYHFYCRLSDSIHEVAEQHTMLFSDKIPDLTASQQPGDDPLWDMTQKQKQCEQLLLFLKSLQIVATALHTLRNKVKGGTLTVSDDIKQAARDLNERYKKLFQLCQAAKDQCVLSEGSKLTCVSAEKILYFQAINDCRTAALDEMFEGNLESCVKRYKRALILLDGLSLSVNDDLDRNRLSTYNRGIRYRLQHLEKLMTT